MGKDTRTKEELKTAALKQEARDIEATMESPYINSLPPALAQNKMAGYRRRLVEINKQLNGNEPKICIQTEFL